MEDWNLISLSEKKHNAMHDRVTHNMTRLGLEWQDRKKAHFINYYKKKGKVLNTNAICKLREYGEDIDKWNYGSV